MSFKTNLKKLRLAHNLTQGQMADYLNVGRQSYQSYEEGRAQPSIEVFTMITELFEVSPREMIGGTPQKKVSEEAKVFQELKKQIEKCYQLVSSSRI